MRVKSSILGAQNILPLSQIRISVEPIQHRGLACETTTMGTHGPEQDRISEFSRLVVWLQPDYELSAENFYSFDSHLLYLSNQSITTRDARVVSSVSIGICTSWLHPR